MPSRLKQEAIDMSAISDQSFDQFDQAKSL